MSQQICLTMIVKNEASIIRRCLDIARPMYDTWCIVDTGSTDGTQDVIREHLAGVPGELHERPWVDFAHNRQQAIDLAKEHGDYLLLVDADDKLHVPDRYVRPEFTEEAYDVDFNLGNLIYRLPILLRSDLPWHYVGVIHEYLSIGRPHTVGYLDGLVMECTRDGARSQQSDVDKYSADVIVLEQALIDEPDNTRYAFYLAQSLRDSLQTEKALAAYEARAAMGGFDQEVYWSLLQAGRLAKGLGRPPAEVIDRLLRAHDARPSRVEALGDLAVYCRELGDRWPSAKMFVERALALPISEDVLFVERDWYEWKLVDELAVAAYWLGEYDLTLQACNDLLDNGRAPKEQRQRIRDNKRFAAQGLGFQV
ncbi:glycosyltransferase [Nocardioides marmorisolisilvae]|uniref:Glycosyltransferase n=1 Tax=Nocardioides marmorisolisilvae TaxID=1542737 RepID=A0A3N0DRT8_9ACTN|nr:glycosyltransferase [Nocardioides marmorisolisilvae]RNL78231.1 glycosyltransferase [Nocardioides marmorisolisilvae]